MTEDEFRMLQTQVITLAQIVRYMPLEAFIAQIGRAEVLGPMLEPTLFRETADRLATVKRMAIALRGFQQSLPTLAVRTDAPDATEG